MDCASDAHIIQGLTQGDEMARQSIACLIRRFKSDAIAFLRNRGADTDDAKRLFDTALSELWIKVSQGKYRDEGKLRTFLFAICKYLWYAELGQTGQMQPAEDLESLEVPELSFESELEKLMQTSELERLLDILFSKIGETCKKILLWHARGIRMEEIARMLPQYASAQAVMNKKSQCMKEIRDLLNGNENLRNQLRDL